MNILGSRKIFKNWPWLQLIVLLIATIHGYFFIGGYRLTADDVSYHLIAMNGIKSSMIFIQDIAISQGRIVQFPDIATSLIGSFYADYIFFRAFYVILYLLNFFLFSLYLNRAFGLSYFWFFAFILLIFHPLDYFHTSPNAYPFKIFFPILLILCSRLKLLEIRMKNEVESSRGYSWLILCLFAMFFSEYAFAFALSLFLIEYVSRVLKAEQESSKFRILQNCSKQVLSRWSLHDFCITIIFLIFYLGFRFYFPSTYDGNKLPENFNFIPFLKTLSGHIIGGSVITSFVRESPLSFFTSHSLNLMQYLLLLIYFILSFIFSIHTLRKFESDSFLCKQNKSVFLAGFFSLISSVIVSFSVAITTKYQSWCTSFSSCVFLDSSLAYFGFGFLIGVVILFLSNLAKRVKVFGPYFFAFSLATIATLALLNNMRVETSMKNYVVGWERAKALACFSEAELQKLDLSSFVEPTRRISMHPNFDSDKYWSMFIDNQRSKISKKDCINKYDKLFPGFELNKKLYFNITGKANVFLADGWSGAESLGIWSESGRANLLIPLRYDYDSIDLEVSALVNKNYPIQHFDVYLNGELIRIIELDKASDNLIKLNKINKDIDKLGLLSFMFRDAISPFDLGLSDDNRTLAIGLVSIKFNKQ